MTPLRFEFSAMAASCEVVIAGLLPAAAAVAAAAARTEVQRIERKYSRYRADSVVGQINARAPHQAIPIDEETAALLDYADSLYQLSGGLFDITTGLLQGAWDFHAGHIPLPAELAPLLGRVGWHYVRHDRAHLRFDHPDVRIDFGGFGKEYAADRAAGVLAAAGVAHGYVNLGGDLRALGPRPDGSPWLIGIRHPRRADALIASIPLASGGLATSGDYERYFERDGRRYCHLLSPVNGMPVTHWQSVSVLAPIATLAGSASTIAMLKQHDGLAFLRESGFSFLAIDANGRSHTHQVKVGTGDGLSRAGDCA